MLTGAIFGLLTAVIWGAGDFLSRKPSAQIGSLLTSSYTQPIGLVLLLGFSLVSGIGNPSSILLSNQYYLGLTIFAGVLGFAGLVFLYKGYYSGVMSVVAPISGSYPAITVTLSVVLLGTVLSGIRSLGIIGVIAGIILTGVKISDFRKPVAQTVDTNSVDQASSKIVRGVDYAIATCVCAGFALFTLGVVSPVIGPILSVVIFKFAETIAAVALIFLGVKKIVRANKTTFAWLAIIGICDALGFVTYNYGVQAAGDIPIVVTLSSLLGVITVFLARVFYKERLGKLQTLGVFVIFASVAVILYFQ